MRLSAALVLLLVACTAAVTVTVEETTVVAGGTLTVVCTGDAALTDGAASVVWTKGGAEAYTYTGDGGGVITDPGPLTGRTVAADDGDAASNAYKMVLSDVQFPGDEDDYDCTYEGAATAGAVTVNDIKVPLPETGNTLSKIPGGKLPHTFTCSAAAARPAATIEWKVDGTIQTGTAQTPVCTHTDYCTAEEILGLDSPVVNIASSTVECTLAQAFTDDDVVFSVQYGARLTAANAAVGVGDEISLQCAHDIVVGDITNAIMTRGADTIATITPPATTCTAGSGHDSTSLNCALNATAFSVTITAAAEEDAGQYECTLSSGTDPNDHDAVSGKVDVTVGVESVTTEDPWVESVTTEDPSGSAVHNTLSLGTLALTLLLTLSQL